MRDAFGRSLVLNATFEPLCVVSSRRALVLVLDRKAEMVHATGVVFRSARAAYPEPSVVRLGRYVRVPRQTRLAITRRAVFARDGHRCQYGGAHSWDNVVAACRRCNAAKEDRLLEEAGLTLRRPPRQPRSRVWLLAASGDIHEDWGPYVAPVLEHAVGL